MTDSTAGLNASWITLLNVFIKKRNLDYRQRNECSDSWDFTL